MVDSASVKNIFIYGSCVTRDLFEYYHFKNLKIGVYLARQSFLSVGKKVPWSAIDLDSVESNWRKYLISSDLSGSALAQIRDFVATKTNPVILVDLVDERTGIFTSKDGEYVVTNSIDADAEKVFQNFNIVNHPSDSGSLKMEAEQSDTVVSADEMEWKYVPFGSDEHYQLFKQAAENIKTSLIKQNIFDRTVVLTFKWAEPENLIVSNWGKDDQGNQRKVKWFNEKYDEYYSYLASSGWQIFTFSKMEPESNPNHKWGSAPFHYFDEYYIEYAKDLENYLSSI